MPDYDKVEQVPQKVAKAGDAVTGEAEKKHLKPVAKVQKRKRGVLERLVIGLIGPDGLPSIGRYLGSEVVMPAVKDIIANSLTTGIQMAIFGKDAAARPRNDYRSVSRAGYGTTYSSRTGTVHTDYTAPTGGGVTKVDRKRRGYDRASQFNSEDYIMDDRNEALEALANLQDQADKYDQVSLADFYDLMGQETQYTDNNYGWLYDDIMKGKVVVIGGGYALRLPRLENLE